MAFAVTPTSGNAPYTFTASFSRKELIDGVNFGLTVRTSVQEDSCATVGTGTNSVMIAAALLASGSYVSGSTSVSSGSCSTYTARITNLITGEVVSISSVTVDNTV